MEWSIMEFHWDFYNPAIQKLSYHLPHVKNIGTHQFGNTHREEFKCSSAFQYVLCCRDYAEHVVAIFSHQIKSEYYGSNRYVSIEGIYLEHFSNTDQETS